MSREHLGASTRFSPNIFTGMRVGHLTAIASFVAVVFATFPSKLVPSKRAVSLGRRSLWKRDIVPKDVVVLNYAAGEHLVHTILHPTNVSFSTASPPVRCRLPICS